MKNKKKLVSFFMVILLCTTLGASNSQKIFPLESPIYRHIANLYILQGKALPSTTGPYSQDELQRMLGRLDQNALTTPAELQLYEQVTNLLSEKPKQVGQFGYDVGMTVSLETYAHTNKHDFTSESDWSYNFNDRKPFVNFTFQTWPTDHFYSYFEISAMNNFGYATGTGSTPNVQSNPQYGESILTTNIPMVPPNVLHNIDLNFPYRAFASAGGNNWNLQIGRDKISWGAGKSGNLSVSNNMPFQQVGRFTTYFDSFKYTLLSSFFTHPQILDPTFIASNVGVNHQDILGDGIKMFLAHRVELRFLKDKAGFTLTESMMYQSSTGSIDIRFLNPVGFYHNQYIRGNSNSMLVLEGDYTPLSGWNIYGQLGIDEIAFGEDVPPATHAKPSAFAYLLGIQNKMGIGKGIFGVALEGVYTDPFFYLREEYNATSHQFGVGFDGIIRVLANGMANLRYVQGYPYGGDAIVGNLLVDYEVPSSWKASLNTMFMAHGVLGITSLWELYDGTNQAVPSTPSTENPFDFSEAGPVEYSLLFNLVGEVNLTPKLALTSHLSLPFIWNKGNVAKAMVSDYQLSFGVHYSI
ncbi:MAG: hypothetical protein RBR15_12590 [Sphaerochaeta sp.]|nr:hypothetical protein [Sphaerochaeta sp.]